ncbi:MAG: hypothetical protein ACYDCQ_16105 [Dehalococcoidia bacterium]
MMVDPVSAVSGGVTLTQGVVQFLGYLRRVRDTGIISALFDGQGNRTAGSDKIAVAVYPHSGAKNAWWFEVKRIDEYSFVRIPLIESGIAEQIGLVSGAPNLDARYWRWIAQTQQGKIISGDTISVNALVDFLIVGYRPAALLKHFSS